MRTVSMMLKAIHSQESKAVVREKVALFAEKLRELKLTAAAKKVEEGIEETLTYMDYPSEHWNRIRTNNTTEQSIGKSSAVQRQLELFQMARAL